MFSEGGSRSSSSEATLSRGKRSLLAVNPLQDLTRSFKLSTPSVNWHKRLGSDDIGADFGTSASNKMELTIGRCTYANSVCIKCFIALLILFKIHGNQTLVQT